jgi:hypothetical protein
MAISSLFPLILLIVGFITAGAISERSLRNTAEAIQGRLMTSLAPLRKAHLFGFPFVCVIAYFFPSLFWPLLTIYFGLSTILVWRRLRQLNFSTKLSRWQAASVGSIFISAILGWAASWLI